MKAHDFEVDGIYYNINPNASTVSVTFKGSSYTSSSYSGVIVIPKTVNYAGFTYLVTAIEDYCFYDCNELSEITIGDGCRSIGSKVFYNCSGLKKIICFALDPPTTFDDTFEFVNVNNVVFWVPRVAWSSYCVADNWQDFYINALTYDFEFDGICYHFLSDSTVAVANNMGEGWDWPTANYSGEITIPEKCFYNGVSYNVVSIGMWAFNCSSTLTKVNIPNTIESIGQEAFHGCTGLKSVTIPENVSFIDQGAFTQSSLRKIIWNARNCSGYFTSVFDEYIDSLVIGSEVETINDYLCHIYPLNISVNSGNSCFDSRDNCNAVIETESNSLILGAVNTIIPNSVTRIGKSAFENCLWGTISIPSSVNYIDHFAFAACSLTDVVCRSTTPPVLAGADCFNSDCYSEAILHVPSVALDEYKSNENWGKFSNVVSLFDAFGFELDGLSYFAESENTAIVVNSNVDYKLYSGDIVIPDSVVYDNNTYIVKEIDANAFDGSFELTSIVIPNSVIAIGRQAFQGCSGLLDVTIGTDVTTIGAQSFNYCNALNIVTCMGNIPPVMENVNCFTINGYKSTLRVPRDYISAYQTTDYWYKFDRIEGFGSKGPGDANGDGAVNISDVTALIDVLLGNVLEVFYFEYGDLNDNGRIDIGDVTTLIDGLLNDNY